MGNSQDRWRQIDEIFSAALDHASSEREAYVKAQCGDDAEMYLEVLGLLNSRDQARKAIGESATAFASPLLPALQEHLEQAVQVTPGSFIGPYRVLEEIGRGGMGAVYLAERADGAYDKRVALKLIKRGMDTDEILHRFQRERQILASLEHPNIARFIDAGASEDGRPYLVMEYAGGLSIDRFCNDLKLPVEKRLALFQEVCKTVQYAHQNLVVHRDLKPSNILVTEDGMVKLLDFGIAKLLTEQREHPLTATGARVMTPEYAAPEQVQGETVTTLSDVYALGIVLYELLTGHRVNSEAQTQNGDLLTRPSAAIAQTVERRKSDGTLQTLTPHMLSEQRGESPEALSRRLKGDLDMIVLKALRHEPERRYASAEAFLEDIKRHLAGLPVSARPGTMGYRLSTFFKRHRWGAGVSALFLLLILGFTGAMFFQQVETARARDEAEMVAAFLEDLFLAPDPFSISSERLDTLRIRDFLDRGVEKVEQELDDQPAVKARLLYSLGRVQYKMGRYAKAQPLLEQAVTLARAEYGPGDARMAEYLQSLGGLFEETSDYQSAEPLYQEALHLTQKLHGSAHPEIARAMSQLGYLYRLTGDLEKAEPLIREALQINRKTNPEPDVPFANSLTRFGILLQEKGDYEAALSMHEEALEIRRLIFEPGHARLSTSIMNVAYALVQNGRYDEAEPLADEALTIARSAVDDDAHFKTAMALHTLGFIAYNKGLYDLAVERYEASLDMFMQLFGTSHRRVAFTLIDLGTAQQQQQKFDKADEAYHLAFAIIHEVLGERHPMMIDVLTGQANLQRRQGNLEAAERLASQAMALARDISPRHPRTVKVLDALAKVALLRGDHQLAKKLYSEALVLGRQVLPTSHPILTDLKRESEH